ncbi:hypothetical protein [Streptacidiphilus neutrinimicus]|uniref:hypothetical protein n=1 Tax=Streptacidiphilus neutrinimicus TaxID=105420 RepID=UPI00126A5204|nr:hypothetical protein [Streptacidiphilus neutrinimicus]
MAAGTGARGITAGTAVLALGALGALAGCGGGPTGPVAVAKSRATPPLSAASLRGGLLPGKLPHGWTVQQAAVNPAPGSPAGVTPPPGCQVLLGEDVVDDSATAAGASASARVAQSRGASATETLYAFAGHDAVSAVSTIRALARRCARQASADGTTTLFSVTSGPSLGDDSLVVHARQTYKAEPGVERFADASVVRVGHFLVVLSTFPVSRPDSAAVASLMPLAVAQFERGAHLTPSP